MSRLFRSIGLLLSIGIVMIVGAVIISKINAEGAITLSQGTNTHSFNPDFLGFNTSDEGLPRR